MFLKPGKWILLDNGRVAIPIDWFNRASGAAVGGGGVDWNGKDIIQLIHYFRLMTLNY